jgi:hypothetical protein
MEVRRMSKTGRPALNLPIDTIREWTAQHRSLAEMAVDLGCSRQAVLNAMHRHGIQPLPAKARLEHNYFWAGGRTVDKSGYILLKRNDHPYATKSGYVREHRLVVERQLGRYLLPTEVVDHIDGNRANNDPANLRVFQRNADHLRATLAGRCPDWSTDGRERILRATRQPRRKRPQSSPLASEIGDPP